MIIGSSGSSSSAPLGTSRGINIETMLIQRSDVDSMLIQRCVPDGIIMIVIIISIINQARRVAFLNV